MRLVAAVSTVFALLFAVELPGQIQTGRIVGTVYDPNKAVVPNALVTVTNKGTNVAIKASTNELGRYVVPSLNPGVYDVSVVAPGFRTSMQAGIEMEVGKDLLLDMDLQLGETTSVVEVNATAPLLSSESGDRKSVV